MINITLKQLRYFEALARHGHFGKAAEACAISQPALSMQIKEMEEVLGASLFERGARQIRLTHFGEVAAERARDILRATEELGDLARASRERLVGRLRIGVIPTVAPYLLPSVVGALTRSYPELDIHVRETVTPNLIDELEEGRLDTAIVALPVSKAHLPKRPFSASASCWCARRGKPTRQCRAPTACARCGCFCWRKAIVFAIRPCPSATCNPVHRAKCWTQVPFQRWSRWSVQGWASP